MPVIYQIDPDKASIHTRLIGELTVQDAKDHLQALMEDPLCPPVLNVLMDLSETISVPDSEGLRLVTEELGRVRGLRFNACAIVVSNDHLFGMARMFAVFAKDRFYSMHVFRTFPNATKWLDSFQLAASPANS